MAISEPEAEKRKMALALGADFAVDPLSVDIRRELERRGIRQLGKVIECVGRPETMEQALALAGQGATVLLFGLTKPDA